MSTIDHDAHHDDAMSHTTMAASRHAAEPSNVSAQASGMVAADAMARLRAAQPVAGVRTLDFWVSRR